ncbi:MAG: hypothetical protein Q9219_002942 [cf. Caloplaca sp. 3 TL-2023]
MVMAAYHFILFVFSLLASLLVAAVLPDATSGIQAIQNVNVPQETHLNATLTSISFPVPESDITVNFRSYGRLIYQTDISLCLLEGISDLFRDAVKYKGDGGLIGNKFSKEYGASHVVINSYSPPAFRMTRAHTVNTLRGIAFFQSMRGYFQVDFDVYSRKDGHVGVGTVG